MDPTNDLMSDLTDFGTCDCIAQDINSEASDDNNQDIHVIVDRHLFENGSDLFGLESLQPAGPSMPMSPSNFPFDPPAYSDYEGYDNIHALDRLLFDNNVELFTDQIFDAGLKNFAPIDLPISRFRGENYGQNVGLSLAPAQAIMPQMPALEVDPLVMFREALPSLQIVPSTLEEQQQWQAFKNQLTRFSQPQVQIPQLKQTQTAQQWENVDAGPGPALQSPFETSTNELFQDFTGVRASLNPQQAPEIPLQEYLSNEQIHLLQNVEPALHVHSSIEFSRTDADYPQDGSNAAYSPQSRTSQPFRTPTADQTPQTNLAGLSFASLDDAEEAMPSRYIENAWEAPSEDPTIPTTQAQRAEYVIDLFEAFQDCSECKDNKNGNSYVKRWLYGPGSYYNLHAMEKVCWHMLDIAEHLHSEGPQSTIMYCEEALKKLKASRDMSFRERISHVCAMLRYSKYLCDQLMKGEGLEALVGAPKLKMSGATTMQVQNQRRQKWIVYGRTEDSFHSNPDRSEGGDQDGGWETRPRSQTKPRATPTKLRAKPENRSTDISRDESHADEEVAYRRQSDPSIARAGLSPDVEMENEPQQVIAAVLRVTTPSPPASFSLSERKQRCYPQKLRTTVSIATPSPAASPMVTPASPARTMSPKTAANEKRPSRSTEPQVRTPPAEIDAGPARYKESQKRKIERLRNEQETKPAAERVTTKAEAVTADDKAAKRKTQSVSSIKKKVVSNKAVTVKIKTKNATRKRPIGLTVTDSEADEPTPKVKRQRTTE